MNGFSLPPISSAAVGIPTKPNIGQQLGEAVAQFPQQMQQEREARLKEQQAKLAIQSQKATMEEAQQKQALSKLGLYYRMALTDQTGGRSHDPNFIKGINDAAKQAGLGSLTQTDPATGAESVDIAALKHLVDTKLLSEFSPSESQHVEESLPGDPRRMAIELAGGDPSSVSKTVLDAPPISTFAQRTQVVDKVAKELAAIPAGQMTTEGMKGQLAIWGRQLSDSGVPIQDLKDYMQTPEYLNQTVAPLVQAKINEYRAMGIKEDAIAKYTKQKMVDEPKALAEKLYMDRGTLAIRQENATERKSYDNGRLGVMAGNLQANFQKVHAYVKSVQDASQKAALGVGVEWAKAQATILQTKLKPLMDERQRLTSEATAYINNSDDHQIPPAIDAQIKGITEQIDQASAAAGTLLDVANSKSQQSLSRMTNRDAKLLPQGKIDLKNLPEGTVYNARTKQYRTKDGTIYNAITGQIVP